MFCFDSVFKALSERAILFHIFLSVLQEVVSELTQYQCLHREGADFVVTDGASHVSAAPHSIMEPRAAGVARSRENYKLTLKLFIMRQQP